MKHTRTLTLAVLLIQLFASSCQASKGTITITEEQLSSEVDKVVAQYSAQGMELDEAQLGQVRTSMLEQLVQKQLLIAEAVDQGYTVEDEEVQSEMEQVSSQFADEQTFLDTISQYGYTRESLQQEISDALLVQNYLKEEVTSKVEVSEQDIQEFYDENPQYFETPETVTASHILILLDEDADEATRAEAMSKIHEIQDKLAAGEDFADLAVEYSEGPSGPDGGDLGSFERGQMVEPFEDAAFALGVGEVSDVVETQFGLHLIKVRAHSESEATDLATVSESIESYLQEQKQQDAINAEIERLKEVYELDVPEV